MPATPMTPATAPCHAPTSSISARVSTRPGTNDMIAVS
jgi:hypothetical protein